MARTENAGSYTRPGHARIAIATGIGTTIEYYDFLIYVIASAIVFNTQFFHTDDPLTGTLLAFATLGVGFFARPVGGIIAGHYGDRLGRKFMLIVTIVTMATATFLIGVLPTYAAIGVLAPIALVVLRLIQGLATGGEWGGAALTAVENAPAEKRGLYGSWTPLGTSTGALLAIAAFALLGWMDPDTFMSWGWRIPFIASIALLGVGLYVRLGLTETEDFRKLRESGRIARMPVLEVLKNHPGVLLKAIATVIGFSTWVYVAFTFVLAYGTLELGLSRQMLLNFSMIAMGLQLITTPLFAALSDRFGRKPVMMSGTAFLAVYAFAFFPILQTKSDGLVLLALVIAYNATGAIHAPMAAYFAELYDARMRYCGASMGIQIGHVLGGGVAPFLTTALYAAGDSVLPVALYLSGTAIITLVALVMLPETAPRIVGLRSGADAPRAGLDDGTAVEAVH